MRLIILILAAMIFGCGSETEAEPALTGAAVPVAIVQLPRPELEADYAARGGTAPDWATLQGFQRWEGEVCVVTIIQRDDFPGGYLRFWHQYLGHEVDHCNGYKHEVVRSSAVLRATFTDNSGDIVVEGTHEP